MDNYGNRRRNDIASYFQVVSTSAVILGIIFGIIKLRNLQAMRKREAAIPMLNSIQTTDFVLGLLKIFELAEGISKGKLEKIPYEQYLGVNRVIGTWKNRDSSCIEIRSSCN
jgi:hypothetical protein